MKLLIVDDEKGFADALKDNFEFEGYTVDCAYGGVAALDRLKADKYHLVVLDVMMPDLDGFGVLAELRKTDTRTPVIFLTARAEEDDRVNGMCAGADDYVTKPFSILELVARVKAVLKRTARGSTLSELQIGDVNVDLDKMCLQRGDREEPLGRFEVDLIRLLASNPEKVFSRDEILDEIWGMEAYPSNRTVDNVIVKLRQKIETDPKQPKYIQSVYGKGYKLVL